jgi:hypothetical protein
MQVKQIVTTKFYAAYCSWNSLEFTDENGDEVSIKMTDDDYLKLSENLAVKAERIRKERADEAAEQQRALEAKENEDG